MQLNYLNKPYFENGCIKNISDVLKQHGIKNPLICTDPGLASIGMSDKIFSNKKCLFCWENLCFAVKIFVS